MNLDYHELKKLFFVRVKNKNLWIHKNLLINLRKINKNIYFLDSEHVNMLKSLKNIFFIKYRGVCFS